MALDKNGELTPLELARLPGIPPYRRLKRGPCAVIECAQPIPCNPCEGACPSGAIRINTPITNVPSLDTDKCTGCGACMPCCPGLAIFVIDLTYSKRLARVSIPYEFLPLPKKGDMIMVLGRKGEELCNSQVLSIRNPKKYDHTPVVSFLISKNYAMRARHVKVKNDEAEND